MYIMSDIVKEEYQDNKIRQKEAKRVAEELQKENAEREKNRGVGNRLFRVVTDSALAFLIIFGSVFGITQVLDVVKHTKEKSNFDMPFDPEFSPYEKKNLILMKLL